MSNRIQRWQGSETSTALVRDGGALRDLGAGAGRTRSKPKREPLVLLHPFSLCSAVWKPILPALEAHHDVHLLSIPGHHGSDPLPEDYCYSIEATVDALERSLDALGIDKAHLVGNSLGGWLAIELARRGRALSVVALAPGGGWEKGSRDHRRLVRRFRMTKQLLNAYGPIASRLVQFSAGRAMLLRDAVASPSKLRPDEARLMIERTRRCAAYDACVAALPDQALSAPFDELPCPMRIVWGAEDRLLPLQGYSERWRRILPGAEWMVLDGVGHVQMYDDPRAVAASILGFTRRVHARSPERAFEAAEVAAVG
ncbi:MAG: alpha/beta hydrolase [Polyangiales bacterium]